MKSRTFKHHVTGRTIIRELNLPSYRIPEYYPPGYLLTAEQALAPIFKLWKEEAGN